ncbi:cleavage and polyadenylation specificity factor (CPSF) A subunit protein [Actinidia rufa]|uniref:Cleavage and polyadenylation specificity factor (CPSF) A subunit protein n=1 Tax=Actinidia rufa TaxID=165716 RepID=A0A7J0FYQ1_9ERIC|nr:cleavage and polyadenylation specificity factor (CPSF) A subunit protein [Actinidia rufa]
MRPPQRLEARGAVRRAPLTTLVFLRRLVAASRSHTPIGRVAREGVFDCVRISNMAVKVHVDQIEILFKSNRGRRSSIGVEQSRFVKIETNQWWIEVMHARRKDIQASSEVDVVHRNSGESRRGLVVADDGASPECNLTRSCSFYMGEIAMSSIRKGSFSYKLPADDIMKGCDVANTIIGNSIMASTLLGSIVVFIPISREEYELLEVLQSRLVVHPLTAPILGNDHNEFRSRQCSAGVPKILDGDMLAQFLELTSMQQEAVVALPLGSPDTIMFSSKSSSPATNYCQPGCATP